MKMSVPKLIIKPHIGEETDQIRMIFAGAGHAAFIEKLIDKMWMAAEKLNRPSMQFVIRALEDVSMEWHTKIQSAYPEKESPQANLLIAVHCQGVSELLRCDGPLLERQSMASRVS